MNRLKQVSLLMPPRHVRALQRLVERGYYPNRAEAIRTAVRDLLKCHDLWPHGSIKETRE